MAPHARAEKSQLKRGRPSAGESPAEFKKPRRSQRIQSQTEASPATAVEQQLQLPSPLTHQESTATEHWKDGTATPPEARPSQVRHLASPSSPLLSSPPSDTQVLSQFVPPAGSDAYEVEDEEAAAVWGYLVPLDKHMGAPLVLKRRAACPPPSADGGSACDEARPSKPGSTKAKPGRPSRRGEAGERHGRATGGYLVGRHPECDCVLDLPTISNRHCLLFPENSHGRAVAMIEDLSSNGTFVNDGLVGRNKRRQLRDLDEITLLDQARFSFRYPRQRKTGAFSQHYSMLQQLGKGHFASVHLCLDRATGARYAVKVFGKRPGGADDKTRTEGLQQEIAVLMSVSHANVLCLKDTFDDDDGVYLVLELAPEGELFNWIIVKTKLTEAEARKVFVQLFHGLKYLHERGIVHRDIKPENILLVDKELTVKLADFGLAKIIGEQSFTTTLCGTPSYVAPEILEDSSQRKYTRAVDVWSLGVVLYICLCGFPPFSDELNTPDNPYTLSQQIKLGRFDYPSPYWDSVGDPALDLIDRMLTVEAERRITVDECLCHPWLTQHGVRPEDSTDGLTGAMGQLDFSKRKVRRERTLLSDINQVRVARVIGAEADQRPVKVFEKNATQAAAPSSQAGPARNGSGPAPVAKAGRARAELDPAGQRHPEEFMELGGKGDQALFNDDDDGSVYVPDSGVRVKQ